MNHPPNVMSPWLRRARPSTLLALFLLLLPALSATAQDDPAPPPKVPVSGGGSATDGTPTGGGTSSAPGDGGAQTNGTVTDDAAFVKQNVPTAMAGGQQYSVSVTMRNTGTSTWTDGNAYHLGSSNLQDNTTWATTQGNGQRVVQPLNVPPGASATFAFVVTAPAPTAQRTYNFQWRMVRDGVAWFGLASDNVVVTVSPQAGQATRPQVMAGGSNSFGATGTSATGNQVGLKNWEIDLANGGSVSGTPTSSSPPGWAVTYIGGQLHVTVPSGTTPSANDTAIYITKTAGENASGPSAAFDIIAGPVTAGAPWPTGAPYPWQAGAGGVNTANGNKLVSIPLCGWTGRGGMPVGVALTFNSLNGFGGGSPGGKWTATYDTVINGTSATDATITWGDGRRYIFRRNSDGSYTPPAGIYDTLTANGSNSSFDLTTKGRTVYHFGNWGGNTNLPGSIVDESGNTIGLTRSGYGSRVSLVTDQTGRTMTLTYDGNGRLNFVRNDVTNQYWTLSYDGNGNLTQINWPGIDGTTPHLRMVYDGGGNVHEFDDLKGSVAWYANYNNGSSLQNECDGYGNYTSFDYSSGTKVTDPNNHATTYVYAGAALQSVTDATGKAETYAYDVNYDLISKIDRRGKTWSYDVDTKHGNATASTDPIGNRGYAVYDVRNGKTLQTTDALGHSTTLVYDNAGVNLLSTTDGLGHTSTVDGYTASGLPASVSDALGHGSTMGYDGDGNLTLVNDANGNSSSATYNRAGWKLTGTDGLGRTTAYRYDAWGRVRSVNALPAAGVPLYRVGDSNYHELLTASQSEYNGNRNVPSFGALGGIYAGSADMGGTTALYRLYKPSTACHYYTTDANQRADLIQNYGFNDEGVAGYVFTGGGADRKPVYIAYNPNNYQYLFTDDLVEYNGLGGDWQRQGVKFYLVNNTVSTTYDFNGNVLTATDPNGHTVTNTYDNDNRLLTTTKANGDTVSYIYDASPDPNDTGGNRRGRLVYKTDGNGNATGYGYLVRGELAQIGYPDGTNESFTYDEAGGLLTHTKQDHNVIRYAYDDDGRLTTTTYPDAAINPTVTVGYDAAGRRTTMQDGLGTTHWAYDAADRLTALSSGQQALSYAYDDAGRLTSKALASVGTWTYQYDAGGRLMAQGTPQGNVTYAYDAADRLSRLRKGNGMLTDYAYGPDGRATEVLWHWDWNSTLMGDSRYRYGAAGELLEHWDPTDGSDTTYSYDGAGQLASEGSNGYSYYGTGISLTGYTYDRNGNRLSKSVTDANGTRTDTYTYQANHYNGQVHTDRLASVSGGVTGTKAFGYDAMGGVRSITANGQTLYLSTDYEDRVTRFDMDTGPGRGTVWATEAYNGLGARFFRHDAAGHDHYAQYDGASPGASLLYDSAGGSVYTPGVAQTVNGLTLYTNVDALGSVHDAQAGGDYTRDARRFDAFGGQVAGQGPDAFPLGFAASSSYQTDADTGLMLLGNRYYDPSIGRFLSQDRVHDGSNWYAYCGNNPLGATDPTGDSANPSHYTTMLENVDASLEYANAGGWTDGQIQEEQFYAAQQKQWSDNNKGSWEDAIDVFNFWQEGGTSVTDIYYQQSGTAAQDLLYSPMGLLMSWDIAGHNYAAGFEGNSGHIAPWFGTLLDPFNGTQAQLGYFDYKVTANNGHNYSVEVTNTLSLSSLFGGNALGYHVPDMPGGLGMPYGNVTQHFIYSFPVPASGNYAKPKPMY